MEDGRRAATKRAHKSMSEVERLALQPHFNKTTEKKNTNIEDGRRAATKRTAAKFQLATGNQITDKPPHKQAVFWVLCHMSHRTTFAEILDTTLLGVVRESCVTAGSDLPSSTWRRGDYLSQTRRETHSPVVTCYGI
jgi:hypothetical protein